MTVTVIYGAMRTGKTLNAEAFRQHYGCLRILDGWPHDGGCRGQQPEDGDLILTTEEPRVIAKRLPRAITLIPINDARRAIGLGPAPEKGFV